ncbi:mycothiol transferase, partial [Nocardia tengchongensis]
DSVPTPTAPWAPERVWLSVRYILLHILREIAHHSGHADIIREALDGANTTYQRAN